MGKVSLYTCLLFLCSIFAINAQVTTSSMSGKITSATEMNEPVIGATVVAIHVGR